MTTYAALLRAVNVGGTSLAMAELRRLCEELGYADVQTYIQSGNVVFETRASEGEVVAALAAALEQHLGKPVGVVVRTGDELAAALGRNPFRDEPGNRVVVIFLPVAAPPEALDGVEAPGGERVVVDGREVFVHYPDGQGHSKLRLPFAKAGTARNVNTVSRLVGLTNTRPSD